MATNIVCDDPVSLVCKLCDKTYQHKDGPLMLPCLHSFCKPCLAKYIEKGPTADSKMACPMCNDRFPFPKHINNFPVNLHLSHLTKKTEFEKQAEGGKINCQACSGNPKDATTFFRNQCKFLCDDCKRDYQRLLASEDEEFIDLTIKRKFRVCFPPAKCPQHMKHDLELFCNDCKTLICLYCSQTEHQNHEKSSIDKTAMKEKAELQQLTNDVESALDTMDQTLQQIQDTRNKVKVSAKEATNRIDKACDKLIQAVEKRREFLKSKCWDVAEGKDDVLSNQMVELQCLKRNLGYADLQANNAINNHNPEEFLHVEKAIEVRLNQVKEAYQRQSMEIKENDSINTSVEIRPLVKEIQKVVSFPNVPDPSKCHMQEMTKYSVAILGKEKKKVVLKNKEKKINVALKDEAGKPIEGKCHFQYELRKVGKGPNEYIPPKVTVTQSSNHDGTATLGFTPDQPGEYELTIMVRNIPIANPLGITARQSIRDYSNFQHMNVINMSVGGRCHGVAVHGNGTIYATDNSGNTIKVFKHDGTECVIGSFDNAGGQLSGPCGITLIDDTIYVVSNGNSTVKVYSTDGRFIGGFGGNGHGNGQFSNPYGICTNRKGRVLVADANNTRIQIFTSKGDFIKSFRCSNTPCDVAVDPRGNIHVALYYNHHIAVHSEDGRQIGMYNLGGRLRLPTGICIDGEGNRFISTHNNGVHIADSNGTLVATRKVDGSWGVAMDRNGLICVTNIGNNCVSVYY